MIYFTIATVNYFDLLCIGFDNEHAQSYEIANNIKNLTENIMTTEQTLTIRTADKHLAAQLREDLALMVEGHINFTFYDGAWEIVLEADEKDMKRIANMLMDCENFREGKFTYEIEK